MIPSPAARPTRHVLTHSVFLQSEFLQTGCRPAYSAPIESRWAEDAVRSHAPPCKKIIPSRPSLFNGSSGNDLVGLLWQRDRGRYPMLVHPVKTLRRFQRNGAWDSGLWAHPRRHACQCQTDRSTRRVQPFWCSHTFSFHGAARARSVLTPFRMGDHRRRAASYRSTRTVHSICHAPSAGVEAKRPPCSLIRRHRRAARRQAAKPDSARLFAAY